MKINCNSLEGTRRVVTYARCSTSRDQKPEIQLEELRRYCSARGWQVVDEVIDHGYSGTRSDRPGLKRIMELARSRQVDVVVVVKLDRLFRSLKHLVITLQEFTELDVDFVSIKDQIDVTTASGRLMLHLLAAFAEFERELIVERTILGLEYAKSQGKRLGRPPENTFGQVAKILELRDEGLSYTAVAKRLGITKSAVYRAIHIHGSKSLPQIIEKTQVETRVAND
jgi:DNA invertase Pin-like site-specific DNA recombinase